MYGSVILSISIVQLLKSETRATMGISQGQQVQRACHSLLPLLHSILLYHLHMLEEKKT